MVLVRTDPFGISNSLAFFFNFSTCFAVSFNNSALILLFLSIFALDLPRMNGGGFNSLVILTHGSNNLLKQYHRIKDRFGTVLVLISSSVKTKESPSSKPLGINPENLLLLSLRIWRS